MRNLKRVLSLALALVMVLGMMVITTSAADFTDAEEITKAEAVDVISAIGVITGDNGKFYPTRALTREEGAAFICYLLMGKENADKLVGSGKFADVKADRWSAGEIDYCANLEIIKGYTDANGDLVFNPKGELTAVAFGRMLLGALGYDGDVEGYTGGNWASAIAADMIDVGLDVKNVSMDAVLTREQAAQMVLQALECDMVEYDEPGSSITINGVQIVAGASKAKPYVDNDYPNYDVDNIDADANLQFVEKYFKDLKKYDGTDDEFGRKAKYGWFIENANTPDSYTPGVDTAVYSEISVPAVTFSAATAMPVVAKKLMGYTFGTTKLLDNGDKLTAGVTIGDITFNTGAPIAVQVANATANGKVVEIYVNPKGVVTDINTITYKVEQIEKILTDKDGNVTYDFSSTADKVDWAEKTEKKDDIIVHGEVAKGSIVTTYQGANFLHVYPTTSFQGAQSAYDANEETVTIGGTVYPVGTGVTGVTMGDYTNSIIAKNYFLDQYGNVVALAGIDNDYTNYAQVKGHTFELTQSVDGATPVVTARFVLADGTVATYPVKVEYKPNNGQYVIGDAVIGDLDIDGAGADTGAALVEDTVADAVAAALAADKAFAYELEEGVISLQDVNTTLVATKAVTGTANIATGATSVTIDSKVSLLDEDTVYVLYNAKTKKATTYVGELPAGASLTGARIVAKTNPAATMSTAKVVFGLIDDVSAVGTRDFAYIIDGDCTVELINKVNYNVYKGIKADGSEITLYEKANNTVVDGDALYTWDTDNMITGKYEESEVKAAQEYTVVGNQIVGEDGSVYNTAGASVVYIDKKVSTVDESVCVVVVAKKGNELTNNATVIFVVAE